MILTDKQILAKNHKNGPCMVLAVPGAGKTTMLLERIDELSKEINPEKILSLTFSRTQAMDMKKRFERFLSTSLLLSVLVVLVSNLILILTKINPQVVNNVWSISFIISWVIMLIYPLYILMEKETRGYSIFVAIISIIVFAILSYHALLVVSNYTPLLPKYIAVDERISSYWQELFYSGLIIIYIVHLLNVILLNRLRSKEIKNND